MGRFDNGGTYVGNKFDTEPQRASSASEDKSVAQKRLSPVEEWLRLIDIEIDGVEATQERLAQKLQPVLGPTHVPTDEIVNPDDENGALVEQLKAYCQRLNHIQQNNLALHVRLEL